MTVVAVIASLLLDGYALTHFITHHRTGLSAAAVGACGWVGARSHIAALAPHSGKRRVGMPLLEPIGERNPELVAAVRAEAKARKLAAA